MPESDTIAAVATPPGRGGIGVVRLSGPDVPAIARRWLGTCPPPRRAQLADFRDAGGSLIDSGLMLYFPAPASFTGEHVLELQAHGGPAVMESLLARALGLGARVANPGEFSQRAFLNGKLDLAQAEAVADLIAAGSRQAAAAAARSLAGAFSRRVAALAEGVLRLRVHVEAAIDFPDDDVDFLAERHVVDELDRLAGELLNLRAETGRGAALAEGLRIAILGAPNVGKSSLLNCLVGRDSAIVTDRPGTTRDVLRETLHIDGLALHLADTAGLRDTRDTIEAEGVRRARQEAEQADCVLVITDDRDDDADELPAGLDSLNRPVIRLRNKCDLSGREPGPLPDGSLRLSAARGEGIDALLARLREQAGLGTGEPEFLARRRHLDALDRAAAAMARGQTQLHEHAAGELLAEELRLAQQELGTITGAVSSEDLLGEIFSSFCIGK